MTTKNRSFLTSFAFWSLFALTSGLALGVWGFISESPAIHALSLFVRPFGELWLRALQLIVVPLIVFQLLTALTGGGNGGGLGRTGGRAFGGIALFSAAVLLVSLALATPVVRLYSPSPETVEAIRGSVSLEVIERIGSTEALPPGEWLTGLIPSNVFEAFLSGQIIQVLIITIVFGLAVGRIPGESREVLAGLFSTVNDALMELVRWILVGLPVGVFALMLGLALSTGVSAAGIVVAFIFMSQGIQLLVVLALYPVAAVLGGVGIGRFARAVAPVQLVAVSTRSSLASMPVQIESGMKNLGFGPETTSVLVPLTVTLFKLTALTADPARLLLLAHVFGISLTPGQVVTFLLSVLLMSFGTLGIPRGSMPFRDLPIYAAAGIPLEGYIILSVSGDLQDYPDTVANATGMFAVATALSRSDRRGMESDREV